MMFKLYFKFACIALTCCLCACATNQETKDPQTAANVSEKGKKNKKPKKATQPVYSVDALDASAKEIEFAVQTANAGDLASAITSLKAVTAKDKKAFLGFYNLGLLYERQLNWASARTAYEDALKAEPQFYPALVDLVRVQIRQDLVSEAITTANRYINMHPDVVELNYAKLEALIAAKRYEDAIDLCRLLLKQDEASVKLRYYLASAEYGKQRYRLAEFMVAEALELNPNDYEALFLRAKIHDALSVEDVSLIPGVASTLDQVLKLHPDHLEALWMRGVIYYEASNYAKAEEYFRRMIALNPSVVGGYINLANTLKTVDRGPEAQELLQKAQSLEPNNGLVDFSLGTLYLNIELIELPDIQDMDRLKIARSHFENAQKHWTTSDDINLAKAYIRTTGDAIETLQAMLDAEALFGAFGSSEESSEPEQNYQVD